MFVLFIQIPFKVGSNVNYFAVPHVVNQKDPSFYITGERLKNSLRSKSPQKKQAVKKC